MPHIRLLGPLEIGPEGTPTTIAAAKPRTLLAALAVRVGQPVSTDTLVEALWGDDPPPSAGKLLQIYVSQLRRSLPVEVAIATRARGYALDVPPTDVDVVEFTRLVQDGHQASATGAWRQAAALLRAALDLWRGEPLRDVGPAVLFDVEADRLGALHLDAMDDLYAVRLELGETFELVAALQPLVAANPLRENLTKSLMLALHRSGRQADAFSAYDTVRRGLRDELGIDPGPALREAHAQLLTQEQGPARDLVETPGALPALMTATIGRDSAIDAVDRALKDPATRLITLTGPGGAGKTRLAVVAAARAQHRYQDGAAFVPLETVKDRALVLATIAAALGVREAADEPAATIARELAGRELLVVLDNLEQVVDVGPMLVDLLERLPGLTFLVTSRVLLSVTGEQAFPVPPLAMPGGAGSSLDDIAASGAVALFCERAKAALPSFELTEHNALAVAEICLRLDGLPLAIELAAAQSRTLAPAEFLARLTSRLDAPGPGQRDRPARHRSLRSAIEGSHELLTAEARELFAGLSVFAGGFDLAAAETVCGASPETLSELVDHSVVQVGATAERFSMLETIREFAAELLTDASVPARHAAYYLDLAEAAGALLDGPEQAVRLTQLDREQDNLRAAFAALDAAGDAEGELRLAVALARFWYIRGRLTESRARLGRALGRADEVAPQLRADALRKLSANAVLRGDYADALRIADQALALYDDIGDRLGRARSLSNIGAMSHASGDHGRARASLDAAIDLATEIGADRVVALALNNRGDLCLTLGEFADATQDFSDSLVLLEAQGDATNVARSLLNLALSALGQDDDDGAALLVARSLELSVRLDDAEDIAWCLLARAALLARAGQPESAGELLGAAEVVLREIDAVLKPYERAVHTSTTAALSGALGTAALAAARARGGALALSDAVALARG
ncbi:MAG: BTAD domain-containing putative transcriptional regulator [Mycobacteriales bacterium]